MKNKEIIIDKYLLNKNPYVLYKEVYNQKVSDYNLTTPTSYFDTFKDLVWENFYANLKSKINYRNNILNDIMKINIQSSSYDNKKRVLWINFLSEFDFEYNETFLLFSLTEPIGNTESSERVIYEHFLKNCLISKIKIECSEKIEDPNSSLEINKIEASFLFGNKNSSLMSRVSGKNNERISNIYFRILDDFISDRRVFMCLFSLYEKKLLDRFCSLKFELITLNWKPDLSYLEKLNKSQLNAFNFIFKENNYINLIIGPPGTGKTFLIAHVLYSIFRKTNNLNSLTLGSNYPKILVTAPSNKATDNLLLVYLEKLKGLKEVVILRIGNTNKMESSVIKWSIFEKARKRMFTIKKNLEQLLTQKTELIEKKVIDKINWKKELQVIVLLLIALEQLLKIKEINSSSFIEKINKNLFVTDAIKKKKWEIKQLNLIKFLFYEQIINESQIIFSTVIGSNANIFHSIFVQKRSFKTEFLSENFCDPVLTFRYLGLEGTTNHHLDLLIVDESCQCSEPELLCVLQFFSKKVVLVGDPHQLPATVFINNERKLSLEKSFFQRYMEKVGKVSMLKTQYRMHPLISKLSSVLFYNNEIENGPNIVKLEGEKLILSKDYQEKYHNKSYFRPVVFFSVNGGMEKTGTSVKNKLQANAAISWLTNFKKTFPTFFSSEKKITLLTPYRGQKFLLELKLKKEESLRDVTKNIEISTVDGYQGKESEIVVLITSRSLMKARYPSIGFLSDYRRLNVGITRSKKCLVIIGDESLLNHDFKYKFVIEYVKKEGSFIEIN